MTFIFQKTRNSDGVGKHVHLKFDVRTLLVTDSDRDSSRLEFTPRGSPGISRTLEDLTGDAPESGKGKSLLDLMD